MTTQRPAQTKWKKQPNFHSRAEPSQLNEHNGDERWLFFCNVNSNYLAHVFRLLFSDFIIVLMFRSCSLSCLVFSEPFFSAPDIFFSVHRLIKPKNRSKVNWWVFCYYSIAVASIAIAIVTAVVVVITSFLFLFHLKTLTIEMTCVEIFKYDWWCIYVVLHASVQ